jgi:outer membrane autotransporter protein
MKKMVSLLGLCGLLFATNIKQDSLFINANIGKLKINDSSTIYGVKVGYYFYDTNRYKINNRISIDASKVDSNADFYITSLKLDWIKNTSTIFAPFVGINVGYLYFRRHRNDYSTNVWGGEIGILCEITNNISIELEGTYQKAFEKKDLWQDPLKTVKAGVEVSF